MEHIYSRDQVRQSNIHVSTPIRQFCNYRRLTYERSRERLNFIELAIEDFTEMTYAGNDISGEQSGRFKV